MKNQILSLLACICMCVGVQSAQAQDKEGFDKLLSSFAEVTGLMRIKATDILKNTAPAFKLNDALAYEYLWNKSAYLKPEDCNSYPIAYYKMDNGIVVILFSSKSLDREGEYQINIQSYSNGRMISKRRNLISFSQDLSSSCDIYITKNKESVVLKGISNKKKFEYEQKIKANGQIDKSNSGKHTSTRLYFLEEKKDSTKKRLIAVEVDDLTKKATPEAILDSAKRTLGRAVDLNNYVITKETLYKKYKASYLTAKLVDEGTDKNQITELVCTIKPPQVAQNKVVDNSAPNTYTVTYVLFVNESNLISARTYYEAIFITIYDRTGTATQDEIRRVAKEKLRLREKIGGFSVVREYFNKGETGYQVAKTFSFDYELKYKRTELSDVITR